MSVRWVLCFVVSAVLLGAQQAQPQGAAEGDSLSPGQGTTGSVLTLTGQEFGLKKPRVRLVPVGGGKPRRLKVLSFSDTTITAQVRKLQPGPYQVLVRPAGAAAVAQTLRTRFQALPPAALALDVGCAAPGEIVRLTGLFLGSRKGRVEVSGRRAKLLSWEQGTAPGGEDEVLFRVPAKTPTGTHDVRLKNRLGELTLSAALVVAAAKTEAVGQFGAQAFVALPELSFVQVAGGLTSLFAVDASGRALEVTLVYDALVDPPAAVSGLEILEFSYQSDGVLWVFELDAELESSIQLSLDGVCSGLWMGSFSGTLRRRFSDETLGVTAGSFRVPFQGP
jgi:hypothetical protein